MKTKFLIVALAMMVLCACTESVDGYRGPTSEYHDGIEYIYSDGWEAAHEKAIDISALPNDFVLEFRTTGLLDIYIPDEYKSVQCTILDSIKRDTVSGEILNKPIYASKPYRYLQRVSFETNGEKHIETDFEYDASALLGVGRCRIVLTRK